MLDRAYQIFLLGLAIVLLACSPSHGQDTPGFLVQIISDSPRSLDYGSGVLVDPMHILTRSGNIDSQHSYIEVRFDGQSVPAKLLVRHESLDLALLKLNRPRYEKPVEVSDFKVRSGMLVTAWGYPGLGQELKSYTGKVYKSFSVSGFRFEGKSDKGSLGGPVLVGGKLVGIQIGYFPTVGIRCINTPQIRDFLERIK